VTLQQFISLTPDQCSSLAKLAQKHSTHANVHKIENGHIEVEFSFPHRYIISKTGTIFECYDLEYNKYRELSTIR
jgi:hypothetical protein